MSRPQNLKEEAMRMLAQMQGEITYQSSNPCRHGHIRRYVAGKHCVECAADYHRDAQSRLCVSQMQYERLANGELLQGMK